MSKSRSSSGAAVFCRRTGPALACLLLAGCASPERTGTAQVLSGAAVDQLNTTYTVTCDGVVPDGFRATVVGGSARVPADASRPPHYEHYDIRIGTAASGDGDGDGASDPVVLLSCSPQPSNGIVQEVQVFSSTGRPLGPL